MATEEEYKRAASKVFWLWIILVIGVIIVIFSIAGYIYYNPPVWRPYYITSQDNPSVPLWTPTK